MTKKTDEALLGIIDPKNGLRVSGIGILAENTKKILEEVQRIQKNVYFLEQRSQRIEKLLEEKFK